MSIADEAEHWLRATLWGTCPRGHVRDVRHVHGAARTLVAEVYCPTCQGELDPSPAEPKAERRG